jgi:thiosulfate dehydrogenase [quinone] large subunit
MNGSEATYHPLKRDFRTFDWYRNFIQGLLDSGSYTWFAKLIAFGEVVIGIALIVGTFVGIAAFFDAFMNYNFIMAGSASPSGAMLVATIFLVLAWKVAGYYGLDYYLLPRLGTPWSRETEANPELTEQKPVHAHA